MDLTRKRRLAVLGTSPISLAFALLAARSGQSVVVIERRSSPGGAWSWRAMQGLDGVEDAVHLLENRPRVLAHLDALGIAMEHDGPHAAGKVAGIWMPLGLTRVIAFSGVLAKSAARRDLDKASLNLRSLRRSLRHLASPFRYPSEGARGLVATLESLLARSGVAIRYGISVESARFGGPCEGGILATEDGDIAFDSLALTSRANCPIVVDGAPLDLAPRRSSTTCIAMVLENCTIRRRYAEILFHRRVRRVRDLTGIVRPRPCAGTAVLCVERRHADAASDEDGRLAHESAVDLQRLGILGGGWRIVESNLTRFDLQTVPTGRLREAARRTHGGIIAIPSTDFCEELATLLSASDRRDLPA